MSVSAVRHSGFTVGQHLICLNGIIWREALRFVHQRGRFVSAIVRPLVWLFIFAAGFRQILGVSIIPPYETYVLYDVYVTPGLVAMIQLFNGMQSSLSMVYDREMGNMRMLLVSPFPRWFLLLGKLLASTAVSLLQVAAYLIIAWFWGVEAPGWGYFAVVPALVLSGLMMGSLGMLLSSGIRQLENFAGVMNFVIFPMFFASSALYPLWLVQQSSPAVYQIRTLHRGELAGADSRCRCNDRLHCWRDHRLRPRARAGESPGGAVVKRLARGAGR
jgi:ABC-2 type transport system permease protein